MSWQVHIINNEWYNQTEEAEAKLLELLEDKMYYVPSPQEGGFPIDPDSYEHKDYFQEELVREWIAKHQPSGYIVFLDAEGYDKPEIWGYRMIDGRIERTTGRIVIE